MKNRPNPYDRIVFCDFDGTITVKETLVAMLSKFVPEKMAEFTHKFSRHEINLRVGVRRVVEAIPSSEYKNAVDFILEQEIRKGFLEFLIFLKENNVPFVVVSGGLMDSVKARLEAYQGYIHAIYAAEVDASGEFVKIRSEFEAGDELVSKVRVMSLFSYDTSIAIGDGATDHRMALNASMVFARDRLAAFLKKNGKNYVPWENFFDIKNYLAHNWQT